MFSISKIFSFGKVLNTVVFACCLQIAKGCVIYLMFLQIDILNLFLGDMIKTAICVGRNCGMVNSRDKVVIVNAHSPDASGGARIEWELAEMAVSTSPEFSDYDSEVSISVLSNPLPDDKILDWSKLKQITNDIIKCI